MKHVSSKSDGFTLVELLVVISIITLLAGLTIATMGGAQTSAARNRTKGEISALSVAIESYKIDNGDYPRDTNTDGLDATTSTSSGALVSTTPTSYMLASLALYKALSCDGVDGSTPDRVLSTAEKAAGRVYFSFKSGMLYPKAPAGSTTTVTALLDPFRNVYGYSTKNLADVQAGAATPGGYNPTFDLWSTADHDQAGATPTAAWITNW